jgi:hypothetical protein
MEYHIPPSLRVREGTKADPRERGLPSSGFLVVIARHSTGLLIQIQFGFLAIIWNHKIVGVQIIGINSKHSECACSD